MIDNKLNWIFVGLFMLSINAYAQEDLTFYHLGNATPQSSMYNASYFPNAHFYLSLPVISGVNVNAGSSLSYSDLLSSIDGSDSVLFDLERVSDNTRPGDRFAFSSNISLFQFGFSLGDKQAFTLFANERFSAFSYYPSELLNLVAYGNQNHIGETISEDNIQLGGTHYREYGIGYSHMIKSIPGIEGLRIGTRVKYIQGFFDVGTDDMNLSITTNDDLSWSIETNNASIKATGLDLDSDQYGTYLIQNDNVGYGIDLGFDVTVNSKLSVALAINDIGSISWEQEANGYYLNDNSIVLDGIEDLADSDASVDALLDSLESFFEVDTSSIKYKKALDTKYLTSVSYKVAKNGTVTASALLKNEASGGTSFSYGLGYKQQMGKIFGVSGTLSKTSNQKIDFGAGIDLRLGAFQFYGAVNNLSGLLDVRTMENVGARIGFNLVFGRRDEVRKKDKLKKKDIVYDSNIEEPIPQIEDESDIEKTKLSPFPDHYDLDHLEELD